MAGAQPFAAQYQFPGSSFGDPGNTNFYAVKNDEVRLTFATLDRTSERRRGGNWLDMQMPAKPAAIVTFLIALR
jgi:hypothetical protein